MEVSAAKEERSIFTLTAQLPTLEKHFNSLVAGVIMKMSHLHPGEKEFFFTDADQLATYAADHGMRLHGHTLIWHWDSEIPPWMKAYTGDWAAMLDDHVTQICKHFGTRTQSWDVVNEALDESTASGFRESIFFQRVGKKYIENAFIAARAAAPGVDLYYNEYGMDAGGRKLDTMLAMLDDFKARGIPVDGVGFQMHIGPGDASSAAWGDPSNARIQQSFKAVADRGLKVRISEMDIVHNFSGDTVLTDAAAQAQKARYKGVVKAYLDAVPPAQRAGITFWGLVDGETWMNYVYPVKNWPLLFNDDYTPKPAFWGVVEALQGI
ncbi:MAG: xylanase [Rubrivivax sp.]|nr:MAG: xylanase [Rubrivivax sp.]